MVDGLIDLKREGERGVGWVDGSKEGVREEVREGGGGREVEREEEGQMGREGTRECENERREETAREGERKRKKRKRERHFTRYFHVHKAAPHPHPLPIAVQQGEDTPRLSAGARKMLSQSCNQLSTAAVTSLVILPLAILHLTIHLPSGCLFVFEFINIFSPPMLFFLLISLLLFLTLSYGFIFSFPFLLFSFSPLPNLSISPLLHTESFLPSLSVSSYPLFYNTVILPFLLAPAPLPPLSRH